MNGGGSYSKLNNAVDSLTETFGRYHKIARRIHEDGPFYVVRDRIWFGYDENPRRFLAEHPGIALFNEVTEDFRNGVRQTVIGGHCFAQRFHASFQPFAVAAYFFGKPVVDGVSAVRTGVISAQTSNSAGDRATAIAGAIGGASGIALTLVSAGRMASAGTPLPPGTANSLPPSFFALASCKVVTTSTTLTADVSVAAAAENAVAGAGICLMAARGGEKSGGVSEKEPPSSAIISARLKGTGDAQDGTLYKIAGNLLSRLDSFRRGVKQTGEMSEKSTRAALAKVSEARRFLNEGREIPPGLWDGLDEAAMRYLYSKVTASEPPLLPHGLKTSARRIRPAPSLDVLDGDPSAFGGGRKD